MRICILYCDKCFYLQYLCSDNHWTSFFSLSSLSVWWMCLGSVLSSVVHLSTPTHANQNNGTTLWPWPGYRHSSWQRLQHLILNHRSQAYTHQGRIKTKKEIKAPSLAVLCVFRNWLLVKPSPEPKSHLSFYIIPCYCWTQSLFLENNTPRCLCLDFLSKLSNNYCKQSTTLCKQIPKKLTYRQETFTLSNRLDAQSDANVLNVVRQCLSHF